MPEDKDYSRPLVDDLDDKIEIEFVDVDEPEPERRPFRERARAPEPSLERGEDRLLLPVLEPDLLDARHYDLDDTVPIFTSRGCAHRCGFCYNLQYCDRRWRAMTAMG